MRSAANSIVGANTTTWPLGQATLTVTYTPGRTIAPGNTLVVQDSQGLHPEVSGASIQSITHLDLDHISGVGSVPVTLFGPESTRGQVRLRQVVPSEPVVVVYSVSTPPTADRDFPTCLAPMDPYMRAQSKQRARKAVARAFKRAVRRKPRFFRRAVRGIAKRALSPFKWAGRKLFGATGDEGMELGAALGSALDAENLDEITGEVLGAAFSGDNEDLDELMGAWEDELASLDWDSL